MKRPVRPSIVSRPEWLEVRDLRAGGLASSLDVVRDLGAVSAPAAIAGVEVTATIAAKGSVTFEFRPEVAGRYTLLVRYEGDGLALGLTGPGKASGAIRPGPAGPFSVVSLPVEAASYQIKATALGDRPVFVDWELFLDAGVGQAAASGTSLASSPAPVIPLPASSGSSPSGLASGGPGGPGGIVAASSASSASLAVVGGPVGRPGEVAAMRPVGPTSGPDSPALAFAGPELPGGVLLDMADEVAPDPAAKGRAGPIPTLEILADAEGLKGDEAALSERTWWEHLAFDWSTASPARAADLPGEPGQAEDLGAVATAALEPPAAGSTPEEGRTTTARASLGLELLGAAGIATAIARRVRRRKKTLPARQSLEDSDQAGLPLSMLGGRAGRREQS